MNYKSDSDGRKLDHLSPHPMRIQALKAVQRGERPADVAKAFGVSTRSVYPWLADYAESARRNITLATVCTAKDKGRADVSH